MGLIFVKIVFKRTKGEEIKLTDDDLDDIDNGDDGKMADDDGDEDEGVICHTIIQQRHFGDVSCCSPNKRPIRDRYLTDIKKNDFERKSFSAYNHDNDIYYLLMRVVE